MDICITLAFVVFVVTKEKFNKKGKIKYIYFY